jgi:hypothetical protein
MEAIRCLVFLALLGMQGCHAPRAVRVEVDDAHVDLVWACLQRGDLGRAEAGAALIVDPDLRERARLDVLAARSGRAAAYLAAMDAGNWLEARYAASREAALGLLRQQRRLDARRAAVWLEEARRSTSAGRALSALDAAQSLAPGGCEALAARAELLLVQQRYEEAGRALAQPVDGARLRLVRAQLLAATGRSTTAARALLQDVRDGLAVPASLSLLHELLAGSHEADLERLALAVLSGPAAPGWRMERAQWRLQAWLLAQTGDLAGARAGLLRLDPRTPEDDAALLRLQARLDGVVPASATPEMRLDGDQDRPRGVELAQRRLADEWGLAARKAWDDEDDGRGPDLDGFVALLDEAAAGLPGAPALAGLPRRDFGLFGALLEPGPLHVALPGALVVCGKALTLPADIAWFERQAGGLRALPEGGTYEEWHVRRPRIGGYLASRGAAITGAGLDPLVWINLDQLEREARGARQAPGEPPPPAQPAAGHAERRSLAEPLDVARWLEQPSRDAPDGRHFERLLEAVSIHERQHIADFRAFTSAGAAGRLALLLQGGLLPGPVRAEVERRAQLRALREAEDPRLPLAHAASYLPVEGDAHADPHAAGYAALMAEFVRRLDAADWPGGRPPRELGLDPGRVLLQQLHRLEPDVIRAIALAMDD